MFLFLFGSLPVYLWLIFFLLKAIGNPDPWAFGLLPDVINRPIIILFIIFTSYKTIFYIKDLYNYKNGKGTDQAILESTQTWFRIFTVNYFLFFILNMGFSIFMVAPLVIIIIIFKFFPPYFFARFIYGKVLINIKEIIQEKNPHNQPKISTPAKVIFSVKKIILFLFLIFLAFIVIVFIIDYMTGNTLHLL